MMKVKFLCTMWQKSVMKRDEKVRFVALFKIWAVVVIVVAYAIAAAAAARKLCTASLFWYCGTRDGEWERCAVLEIHAATVGCLSIFPMVLQHRRTNHHHSCCCCFADASHGDSPAVAVAAVDFAFI